MIPNALDLLTVFVGLYLIVAIARLGLLIVQYRAAAKRVHASEQRGEQRLLEYRASAEEYQRRNAGLLERYEALTLRGEEADARRGALQERREALQLRSEANVEHLSAVLARLGDLLVGIERRFDER